MTIVGFDDRVEFAGVRGAFRVLNSRGVGWGDSGYAWLSYGVFADVAKVAFTMAPLVVGRAEGKSIVYIVGNVEFDSDVVIRAGTVEFAEGSTLRIRGGATVTIDAPIVVAHKGASIDGRGQDGRPGLSVYQSELGDEVEFDGIGFDPIGHAIIGDGFTKSYKFKSSADEQLTTKDTLKSKRLERDSKRRKFEALKALLAGEPGGNGAIVKFRNAPPSSLKILIDGGVGGRGGSAPPVKGDDGSSGEKGAVRIEPVPPSE